MIIRQYESSDLISIVDIFFNAIHSIYSHYSVEQLKAWGNLDRKDELMSKWKYELPSTYTLVAILDDHIVGFSNINNDGYIDLMYVSPDYQNKRIATTLLKRLENHASKIGLKELTANASAIAKSMFIKQGFKIISKQSVIRYNVELYNYKMYKKL
ncbi:GNAT family N-acetyltransferase [Weissella coleopterorum]|uniref:GNAT family N-acetyltransferase n=1 Tax=Weissella coleopterorum TaxID=2714949 RepID=A0A6G8AZY6_9LACO|nr:GNAT family N-acetyltransferase [Weissella coleopterorum]QIL50566.1 GNAT family N-acetyltransferase [Weissella coleopterorum]